VVKGNGPILRQEFNHVGNDFGFIATPQLVEVVLVEANERPKRLKDYFFVTHVRHGGDETDRVEGEFYVVTLASADVQVVADQVRTVLVISLILLRRENQRIRRLDMIIDQVHGKHTTLALREVELGDFLCEFIVVVLVALGVVDVEDRAG